MDETPNPEKPNRAYGKHSAKYWIAVYIIAAIIIYGLVYLLFFRDSGGDGSGGLNY